MPWSGGVFNRLNGATGWVDDANAFIGIEAGRHDTQDNDFRDGINNTLAKDGTNAATGNLNLGNNRITNLASATATSDAATMGQVQNGAAIWCGTSGGSANAQTLTPSPAIASYVAGQRFLFIAGYTNTSSVTINVSAVGAKNVFLSETNAAAAAYMIRQGFLYEIIYDGTQFVVLNQSATQHSNQFSYLGQSSGTANAIVLTPSIPMLAYQFGFYNFFSNAANTGSVTINISGLGAIALTTRAGNALKAGQIQSSLNYLIYINGSNAYLLNPSRVATSWTPTITQSGNVTATFLENYYYIDYDNNTVTATMRAGITGTGTAGSFVTVSLPVNTAGSNSFHIIGSGTVYDGSTNTNYVAAVSFGGGQNVAFCTNSGGGNFWGQAPSIALANTDVVSFTVTYRV